ncbi:MerR family transcriptional regulator [Actinobaculum sp. 352]|nr:MerR family transcriptional regulator [Actinobaculum sp. 313]RTE49757.1 MerR family transcriptional regulator [Actinobaculum sp. 352]
MAGTTTRAVRHYHRLGLLPVPPVVGGRRDYGLEHLARLLRIRWLAESGLRLSQIAEILPEQQPSDRDAVLESLRATRATIDAQVAQLHAQQKRIDVLIETVERGERLSPVPTVIEQFYDDVESATESMEGSKVIRGERRIMTFLATQGFTPRNTADFLDAVSQEDRVLFAQLVVEFATLPQRTPQEQKEGIDHLLQESLRMIDRYKKYVADVLAQLPTGRTGRAAWSIMQRLYELQFSHPSQQAYLQEYMKAMFADEEIGPILRRSAGEGWSL